MKSFIIALLIITGYSSSIYAQSSESIKRSDLTLKPLIFKTDEVAIDIKNIEKKLIITSDNKEAKKNEEAVEPKKINSTTK